MAGGMQGRPAVEKITRTVDCFLCGPPGDLPDLFVEWRDAEHFVDIVEHPRARIVQQRGYYHRDNYHSLRGFLAASGPGVGMSGESDTISLLDVASIFLSVMGEPVATC